MNKSKLLEKLLNNKNIYWTKFRDDNFVDIQNSLRKPVKSSLRINGKTPYYGANNIQDYVEGYTHDGEFILIAEDGSASLENYSIQYVNGKFWANNHVHVVRGKNSLDTKFLYYYLKTVNFIKFLSNLERSKLTKEGLLNIPVPIPCPENPQKSLEIQMEIAIILDELTERHEKLIAKLRNEIGLRKKQYEYYREKILNFKDGDIEKKRLGDITTYEQPNKYIVESTDYNESFKTPVLTAGKTFILGYTKEKNNIYKASTNPVIIFDDFTTANKWVEFDFKVKSSAMKMIISTNDSKYFLKYIYYCLNILPNDLKEGDHKRQWIGNYMNKKIPIPLSKNNVSSIEKQMEIVITLDELTETIEKLTEKLNKEIELRQKQYEHYRNLLFDFPK